MDALFPLEEGPYQSLKTVEQAQAAGCVQRVAVGDSDYLQVATEEARFASLISLKIDSA